MNYLITLPDQSPFITQWFDAENNFVEGMVVYNLTTCKYTTDGYDWKDIDIDHL